MDNNEKRLWKIHEVKKLEHDRLIRENEELKKDLSILRHKYKIQKGDLQYWTRWFLKHTENIEKIIIIQELESEVKSILNKYELDISWLGAVYSELWGIGGPSLGMGFPSIQIDFEKNETNIIVDKDTDYNNPIIQNFIKSVRLRFDPPPRPIRSKDNPRKLDWRPVWEWHKKHPNITIKEIAISLGKSYNYVRKKLTEIKHCFN